MIKKLKVILNSSILNLLLGLLSFIGLVVATEERDLFICGVFLIISVLQGIGLKNE